MNGDPSGATKWLGENIQMHGSLFESQSDYRKGNKEKSYRNAPIAIP